MTTEVAGVVRRQGLRYRATPQRDLLADVYRPPGPGPFPAVVYFHGGAWRRGDRSDHAQERIVPVAARGIVVVSVSYRFSHEAPWPAQADDAAHAVRWARANADELGIDPARIGVWGASAGGHLASTLAVLRGRTALGLPDPFPEVGSAVTLFAPFSLADMATDPSDPGAVLPSFIVGRAPDPVRSEVALVGVADRADAGELLPGASPLTHVTSGAAPLLMLQGTRDAMMPLAQSRRMADALAGVAARHQLLLVDGATHEDPAFHTPAVLGAVAAWSTGPGPRP